MGEFGIGFKKRKGAVCCKHINEPTIKCEEFLDWLRNCQLLKKDYAVRSYLCVHTVCGSLYGTIVIVNYGLLTYGWECTGDDLARHQSPASN